MRIQFQFLDVLCNRHRLWAKGTTNPEAAQAHIWGAALMREATNLIDHALDLYRQDDHHSS